MGLIRLTKEEFDSIKYGFTTSIERNGNFENESEEFFLLTGPVVENDIVGLTAKGKTLYVGKSCTIKGFRRLLTQADSQSVFILD